MEGRVCLSSASPTRRLGGSGFPAAGGSEAMSNGGTETEEAFPQRERIRARMKLSLLSALNAERAARRAVAHVTDLATGEQHLVREGALGANPMTELLEDRFRSGKSGLVEHQGQSFFLALQVPPARLFVVGAVHVSQALASMACGLDLDVT